MKKIIIAISTIVILSFNGNVYAGQFSDVSEDAWYYDAVTAVAKGGIIKGYPDGTFKPNQLVTFTELAVIAV